MFGILINLIIQIVSGAIGGNVAGGALKEVSLGTVADTIAVQLVRRWWAASWESVHSGCWPTQ